jgi:tetratricopeptide (TPR) repeat protein
VAAYLIDGMSGRYVWADECEASRTDPFAMKDMIVRRLARALQIELAAIKADRLSLDPATRDADVLALRGEAIFLRYGVVREEAQEAYSLCERALQFEPENVRALAILSEKFSTRVTSIQSSDRAVDAARAEKLACQALTVDACSPHAHHAKARVLIAQKRPDAALLEATYSLDLNPNYIPAYLALCQAHLYLGEPKACIADAAQGMTLHPLDPYVAIFHAHTAYAYFMCQDERRAEDHLRRALISNPAFPTATAWLAAVLGLTGRTQEAAAVLHRYESLPGAVTRSIRGWRSIADAERPAYRAFRERLYAGLCAAGMQEG